MTQGSQIECLACDVPIVFSRVIPGQRAGWKHVQAGEYDHAPRPKWKLGEHRIVESDELQEQRLTIRREQWAQRIPPRFVGADVGDLDRELRCELERWDHETPRRNLLLLGPVGTGKTHAAVAAARIGHFARGDVPQFWPVVDLLDALRPSGDDRLDVSDIVDCKTLILDDLGAERVTDWTFERMDSLVNKRWLNELPTIATSNMSTETLREAVGDRLYSRLTHDAVLLALNGSDRR